MVLTTKHRFTIYKRFQKDIWGYCFTDERCEYIYQQFQTRFGLRNKILRLNMGTVFKLKSPYLKYFFKLWWDRRKYFLRKRQRYIYKFNAPTHFRKHRKFNKRFISIRLTRLYFLTFQDFQFRRLFRRAAKMDGNFETNYLRFLEGRVLAIAHRLNFFADIFYILNFIKTGNNFFLDFKPINLVNELIPIGQMITLNKKWHIKIINNLLKRIKLRTLLFPAPKFLYTSYSCFFFYLMRYPKRDDLVYPFAIDLQRITGYY